MTYAVVEVRIGKRGWSKTAAPLLSPLSLLVCGKGLCGYADEPVGDRTHTKNLDVSSVHSSQGVVCCDKIECLFGRHSGRPECQV